MRKLSDSSKPVVSKTRLFSADPGSSKHGFAVISIAPVKIVRCGMLTNLVTDLSTEPDKQAASYRKQVRKIFSLGKVTHVVAERYQARFHGGEVEKINFMLGNLLALGKPSTLYLPATWKVPVKKVFDLEAFYKQCKPVEDHVVDAVMIGLYHIWKNGGYSMEKLKTARGRKALCQEIQSKLWKPSSARLNK